MASSFIPVRFLFSSQFILRSASPNRCSRPGIRLLTCASLTARERRRAAGQARVDAHRAVKQELEQRAAELLSAVVSVPNHVRERCKLTPRMARVKVFLEKGDISNLGLFRGRVRSGLVRLFPELEERGLLRVTDGFDVRVGGGAVIQDSVTLQKGLERCEKAGSALYVEIIPHNLPPPKPPLSERVAQVRGKALAADANPDAKLQMISFYKFVDISKPDILSERLRKVWSRMGVKGRVYVATEGINAQLAVPEDVVPDFLDAMDGSWREREETLVPEEIVGVFLNLDRVIHHSEQPFEKLSVKARNQILADGLSAPLKWNEAGREVPPEEWHKVLKDKSEDVILLDCRNNYESDVGKFEGAEPLNTRTFRESWEQLEKRLLHEDRKKKILTYCTGGIRCVKVNAFLEQKMGFTDTGRLEGGIVSYARRLREEGKLEESTFRGVNHVFDGRMGEVITEDLLDRCLNCNQPCNVQTDCANVECPRPFDKRMFVQCEECATRMNGACSAKCQEVARASQVPHATSSAIFQPSASVREKSDNDRYADTFSSPEPELLKELRWSTEERFSSRCHMLSSHAQASLLRLLVQTMGGTRLLEIGTFTGYATIAMASALPPSGRIDTCELDDEVAALADEFFKRDPPNSSKIRLYKGRAMETLEHLLKENVGPYDLAFIDADKGGYEQYMNMLLTNKLIRIGGLLVFDNVLFRGEVAKIWADRCDTTPPTLPTDDNELARKRLRNLENVRKIAQKLHTFNQQMQKDARVEQVMLPFRDGLTIARRIK